MRSRFLCALHGEEGGSDMDALMDVGYMSRITKEERECIRGSHQTRIGGGDERDRQREPLGFLQTCE